MSWVRGARPWMRGALAVVLLAGVAAGNPFLWVYDQTVLLFGFVVGMACVQSRPIRTAWRVALFGWAILLPWLLYVWANLRGRATGNALLAAVLAGLLLSLSWSRRDLHGWGR